jgi:hypothetical protein
VALAATVVAALAAAAPGQRGRRRSPDAATRSSPTATTGSASASRPASIDDGPNASANYVFAQAIPASDGVTDVGSFLRFMLGRLGVSIGTVLASSSTGQFEQMDFLGTIGSKPVHGGRGRGHSSGGVTSGAIRLAIATTPLWNSVNPALLRVVAGIQHDLTQDDQELLRVQQQIQGFQRQVEGFDRTLIRNRHRPRSRHRRDLRGTVQRLLQERPERAGVTSTGAVSGRSCRPSRPRRPAPTPAKRGQARERWPGTAGPSLA